jgi:N-methylhydantoinase B/oxoprolinase/acetone carboxylase alpha subunit
VPITVTVELAHGELHADFTGSAPQVASNVNAVRAVTRSSLLFAVRVATDPTIPPTAAANGRCT